MPSDKGGKKKSKLHPRNRNQDLYELDKMIISNPKLEEYLVQNRNGNSTIDFSNPDAVRMLNKAILNYYYGINYWEFPKENLCPPIPGRAEYIHRVADLLSNYNYGNIPRSNKVTCLDIGTGASCIYPIIGVTEYDWDFIGSEIDGTSIESAEKIIQSNPKLFGKIEIRQQNNSNYIFKGAITNDDKIDITICNPPFHSSQEEALKGSRRKVRNLSGKKTKNPMLNFSGRNNELIYRGGELKFISNMITESKLFGKNCFWFSTLISKESLLKKLMRLLRSKNTTEVKVLNLSTANKMSRILAWTYLSDKEKKDWRINNWQ